MRLSQSFTRSLALSCLAIVIVAGAALAEKFEPRVGQPGKDVVWVPSPQALVDRMLDIAKLQPGEYHMDLGSGDGRTVITAAKRGATAVGVEFNPNMVALARENAKQAGVTDRATFIEGDLFQADISKANVITLFLLPDINLRLRPKILDLQARHPHRVELVRHGRLDAGPDHPGGPGMHVLVPRASVDRPGQGAGHLEAAGRRRADARAALPDRHRLDAAAATAT